MTSSSTARPGNKDQNKSLMKDTRVIIGDVGGTNCRLASCDRISGRIEDFQIFAVRDFNSLSDIIQVFKESQSSTSFNEASIAIANPIMGDMITMTNAHWAFSIEQTRESCGLNELLMLNDWESVALALPLLTDEQLSKVNQAQENPDGTKALFGVGTGLGAAGLVRKKDSSWVPIAGEGGHVSFSPVNREEALILEIFREHHNHVSFEKILSGPGLKALYQATVKLSGAVPVDDLAPSEIVEGAATASYPMCQRTIEIFCGILGNFAGNLCLTLGATGGVYVGGGVIEKIDQAGLFDRDRFLNRLAHKGRLSEWLGNIPAFLLRTPYAGLIGAAAALGIQNASVIES